MAVTYTRIVNENGAAIRIAGGEGTWAENHYHAIEPGRTYKLRAAVLRAVDSDDEEDDAITLGAAVYNNAKDALLDNEYLLDPISPTVSEGRATIQGTLSSGDGSDIVAPADARYFKAFVRCRGDTPQTDVEVIEVTDITDILELLELAT